MFVECSEKFNSEWSTLSFVFYIPTSAFCNASSSVPGAGVGKPQSKNLTQYRAGWSCPAGQYDEWRYTYCSSENSNLIGATDCMRTYYLHF